MTTIAHDRPRPRPRSRRPSAELVSAGVVAGYVHDISRRHGRPRGTAPARRQASRVSITS
jgi:hypothetical protein